MTITGILRPKTAEESSQLINVALGKEKADLAVINRLIKCVLQFLLSFDQEGERAVLDPNLEFVSGALANHLVESRDIDKFPINDFSDGPPICTGPGASVLEVFR